MILEAAVSAPGKAVLMGEHAAVYGHPAILAALGLRLTATVRSAPGSRVRIDLPGVDWTGEASWEELVALARERRRRWRDAFEGGDGSGFEPVRTPHELALIAAGEAAGRAAGGGALPGAVIRIESALPPGAGCGSSAALAAAVTGALARALGLPRENGAIERMAIAVERQQHGRPSGVDVAAVLRGGILWCRRGSDGSVSSEDLPAAAELLSGLRLFQAGTPRETTGDMIAAVRGLEKRDPLRVRDALATIDGATHGAREALAAGSFDAWAAAVRTAERALEQLGVVPETVARSIRRIENAGGAAKISGAGGITGGAGLVLVVHPEPDAIARLAPPSGWAPLRAELGAPGLKVEVAA